MTTVMRVTSYVPSDRHTVVNAPKEEGSFDANGNANLVALKIN